MVIGQTPSPSTVHVVYEYPLNWNLISFFNETAVFLRIEFELFFFQIQKTYLSFDAYPK